MKKYFIALLVITVFLKTHGQTNFGDIKTYPVAPNAYEFMKYGEIPVGHYTGVPNITIPLYTMEIGDLQLPITLTYHSNGFRVNEEAGWTGLGWTLNEGGIITQIVNGYDDFRKEEYSNGYSGNRDLPNMDSVIYRASNRRAPKYVHTLEGRNHNTFVPISSFYFQYSGGGEGSCINDQETYYDILVNQVLSGGHPIDFEPDIFKFNFFGQSGTFVLDWKTETFKCISDSRYKIIKPKDSYEKITIITPEGHSFIFTVKDETDSYGTSDPYKLTINSRIYKLDLIKTAKGNIAEYFYKTSDLVYNFPTVSGWYSFYENADYDYSAANLYSPGYSITGEKRLDKSSNSTVQTYSHVSKIKLANGVILFDTSNRIDLKGSKKLDKIRIKPRENSTETIKQIDFSYDYFIGNTASIEFAVEEAISLPIEKSETEYSHRLKLKSIQESGNKIHTFEYSEWQNFPRKNSFATDYWGFYNGKKYNTDYYPNMRRFNFEFDPVYPNSFRKNSNNKSAHIHYSGYALLRKITYPTKGYSIFDYELNSFDNCIIPNINDNEDTKYKTGHVSYGAGSRVKRITNFDSDGKLLVQKTYEYKNGKIGTPVLFVNKKFLYIESLSNIQEVILHSSVAYRTSIRASNFLTPSIGSASAAVGYDEVIEHILSPNPDNPHYPFDHEGKIIYTFENNRFIKGTISLSSPYIKNSTWEFAGKNLELGLPLVQDNLSKPINGSLIRKEIYDDSNNILSKQVNTHSTHKSEYWTYGVRGGGLYYKKTCDEQYHRKYLLGAYPIQGINSYLTNTKTTEYFQDDSLTHETINYYTDNFQIKKKESFTSKKDDIVTSFSYPFDYPPNTGNSDQLFNKMISANMLSPVIKKETKLYEPNDSENGKLLSTQVTSYKDWDHTSNNKLLPQYIKSAKGNNPLEDDIVFHKYDGKGNPLEVSTKDGTHTSYIWGYNYQYPIAKAENVNANEIEYCSFESGNGNWIIGYGSMRSDAAVGRKSVEPYGSKITSRKVFPAGTYIVSMYLKNTNSRAGGVATINNLSPAGEPFWAGHKTWKYNERKIILKSAQTLSFSVSGGSGIYVDEIKVYPVDAQMTSYTYDPLIGMTSQTDPNGNTIYYEYDSFGRLYQVKDQDGNVLNQNDYNYAR